MATLLENFSRHAPGLRRFVGRYLQSPDDVEDILQEVFLRAFRENQRSTIFFHKAFLYRVARNLCLNELGRARRNMESAAEDFGGPDVFVDGGHVEGDARLESQRKLAVFAAAVETLPPRCKQIFIMRKIDGMRISEIAKELGISSSAVEKQVAHGLVLTGSFLRKKGYDVAVAGKKVAGKQAAGTVKQEAKKR